MRGLAYRTVLFVSGLVAAWTAAGAAGDELGVSGEYLMGPGDVIRVEVFEVEELSISATVAPDGTVGVPLIGRVDASGRTPLEIQADITRRLADGLLRDPQVTVSIEELHSQPVSIIGAVKEPGVYQLKGRRRLIEVLALAGGLTEQAGGTIVIARGGSPEREIEASVRALLEPGAGDSDNPLVMPQDVVRVTTAGVVYVLGAVRKAGGFPIRDQERMTALSAVSLAEGALGTASLKNGRIIRGRGAAKREIPLDVRRILKGKAPDASLEANDILYIPDSRAKTALNRGTEAIVQMATGLVIWSNR